MVIRPFHEWDADDVIQLWRDCGLTRPWNDPRRDIDRKRQVQPELFLVGVDGGRIIATAMAGYDGHRGWIYYLAVSPDCRGRGLGRRIIEAAEQRLAAMGCPKVNLMVRSDNTAALGFYERIGYTQDRVSNLGKRLEHD
jgi:ribosomal protein S18 acetylase RimI-like enzyme